MSAALRVRELTPRGPGGLAVVALEGPGAVERARSLLARDAPLALGRPRLARLRGAGEDLDEALVLALAPERVELHLHGSPPLVARVLALLGGDAPQAPATLEERALELLARAPSEAGARILLDQAEGALRRELEELRAALASGEDLQARLEALIERGRVARYALEPARVVLAGPVNAGKSTLFNLLLGAARTVVSAAEGTTRDAVSERALLGQWPIDLVDTAGLRELDGERAAVRDVERAGQRLALELLRQADLVLWLDAAGLPPADPPPDLPRVVRLHSRADLVPEPARRAPWISAERDPRHAVATVEAGFRAALDLPEDPWRPGAAVPFDPELRRALHCLGAGEGPAPLAALLDAARPASGG